MLASFSSVHVNSTRAFRCNFWKYGMNVPMNKTINSATTALASGSFFVLCEKGDSKSADTLRHLVLVL